MEQSGRILVIDDELGIREGCRRVLEPQGFAVETAATIAEGLDQIGSADYDLVLLDVMMPDGRGLDLLDPLLEKDPEIVPIIITGYATVELAVEAIKAGAYDFIAKPFTADLLLMTVNQGLQKRRLSLETKRLQAIEKRATQLALAKEELERLQEFKTAFTFKITHELRAPVAGAISLLRPLLRGLAGELNGQQRDMLARIEARLAMLMDLVDDLLALAASRTVVVDQPLETVNIQSAIRRVIDRLTIEAENKHVELTCNKISLPLDVQATKEGLDSILTNLVGNSIKYTPEGGKVTVSITDLTTAVRVTIADSGIGIPQDAIAHIWDEFYRAKNARNSGIKGTGLGLSIVQELVTRFGGTVEVQSVEGLGTTFTVSFPKNHDL